MNAKHTKGPWRRRIIGASEGTLIESPDDSRYIASVNYRGSIGRTNRDCQLIAAAPDLLEACKLAFERLRPKGDVKKDFAGHVAWAALSKAIHKAEGND